MLERTKAFVNHSWPMDMLPEVMAVERELAIFEARLGWSEKAMDFASRLVSRILDGQPTTDPEDLFVREFRAAVDQYLAVKGDEEIKQGLTREQLASRYDHLRKQSAEEIEPTPTL